MVHLTLGYQALGAKRPLDPDLDPVWHKNGQNSPVSSDCLSFDQISKAVHGVIPGGIWVLIVDVTPGYLALGVTRPLDPNLNPVWHKNGQNSCVSSDSLSFDQLSKAAHGVIPSGIWVLIVNWTSGYLALGHRQPLEANLDTVLHKILGLS